MPEAVEQYVLVGDIAHGDRIDMVGHMTDDRYFELETNDKAKLTPEEARAGWHWCKEWDFMLVGPGMDVELECCSCPEGRWARQGGS